MHCGVVVDFGAKCCHLMVVYRSGSYIGGRGMAYAPLSEKRWSHNLVSLESYLSSNEIQFVNLKLVVVWWKLFEKPAFGTRVWG